MRLTGPRSEAEVDLAHHLGGVEVDPVPQHVTHEGAAVEVVVAVEGPAALDAEADVVPDRPLDAAADGAADDRLVVGDDAEPDAAGATLDLGERDAAGPVHHAAL